MKMTDKMQMNKKMKKDFKIKMKNEGPDKESEHNEN